MSAEILTYVSEQLSTIFTGLTMTIAGAGMYEARDGFFRSGKKFRGKHEALIIFLTTLVGVSLLTPMINQLWSQILPQFHPGQILGAALMLGMVAVNDLSDWNQTDLKSLFVHAIGTILLFRPDLIYVVL